MARTNNPAQALNQYDCNHGPFNNLTYKQAIFVREYIKDFNGRRAAEAAGYTVGGNNPLAMVSWLMAQTRINDAIQYLMDKRARKIELSAERVLEEIARMAFANIEDFLDFHPNGDVAVNLTKATREQLAALSEVTVDEYLEGRGEDARRVKRTRIKMSDKSRNLELLGKHLRLFHDVIKNTYNIPIQNNITLVDPRSLPTEALRQLMGPDPLEVQQVENA